MDFDQSVDRSKYPTLKLSPSLLRNHFGTDAVLPMWVADMDFPAPDPVVERLLDRVQHGVFGYEYRPPSYFDALVRWYEDRHRWSIDRRHIRFSPSVLSAVSIVINQHSEEGDGVIIQPPVFFEFQQAIRRNHRKRVKNPLRVVDGDYRMDFEDLEEKAADVNTRILIVCNPHNPVGRVWTAEELARAGEICRQHDVLIISDEIHGDIVYEPNQYTPFASISDELAQRSVTCLSPAKTFNIAGAVDALVVIANEHHREQFSEFAERYQINKTNVFASAAAEAAYSQGGEWLDQLLAYLKGNINLVRTYLDENLPQVRLVEPEGTYLVWLDFRELGLDAKALERFLAQEAGLALNPGYWFGREGAGYARMNIACPRSILREALSRLTDAVRNRL
jgi:cystathionine beta-lyase